MMPTFRQLFQFPSPALEIHAHTPVLQTTRMLQRQWCKPRTCYSASGANHAHVTAPVLQSTRMLQHQCSKPRACYSTSAPSHSHVTAPVLQATAQSVESRALTRPRQDLVHCRLYYTQGIIHNPRKYPVNLELGSRAVPLDTRVLKLKPPRTTVRLNINDQTNTKQSLAKLNHHGLGYDYINRSHETNTKR